MVQRLASEAQREISQRHLKETAGTTLRGSLSSKAAAIVEAEARAFRERRGSEAELEVSYTFAVLFSGPAANIWQGRRGACGTGERAHPDFTGSKKSLQSARVGAVAVRLCPVT